MNAIIINASRDVYRASDAAEHTMTVEDLRYFLDQFDDKTPVILSFDGGYTYGKIREERIEEAELNSEE